MSTWEASQLSAGICDFYQLWQATCTPAKEMTGIMILINLFIFYIFSIVWHHFDNPCLRGFAKWEKNQQEVEPPSVWQCFVFIASTTHRDHFTKRNIFTYLKLSLRRQIEAFLFLSSRMESTFIQRHLFSNMGPSPTPLFFSFLFFTCITLLAHWFPLKYLTVLASLRQLSKTTQQTNFLVTYWQCVKVRRNGMRQRNIPSFFSMTLTYLGKLRSWR